MGKQGTNGIAWTDQTWNPVTGCTKVSQGCKFCYAETIAKRFWRNRKFTDVRCHEDRLEQPLHWKKPRMVFVNSMSDLFHENVPYDFITKVLMVIDRCKQHTFQILTKRPERMRYYFEDCMSLPPIFPLPNLWLGVSVEDNDNKWRMEYLKNVPAVVHFVSFEPLLERLNDLDLTDIEWAIIGGESGNQARGMKLDWARQIRDVCKTAGTAFFMKQLSQYDVNWYWDFERFPSDLRIREFPKVK